jgi:hypothetical protein
MVASSNNLADDTWYLDSRASHHLTQNMGNLTSSTPYTGTNKVIIGNGKHLSISNTGSQRLVSNSHSFQLKKVFHVCFSWQFAKRHRLPTHLSLSHASKPLELVHTNIWGTASVKSTSGAKYFILFLDNYSQYT